MGRQIPGGVHQVQFGTSPIPFEVIYTSRQTLAISVYPDGTVVVKAPTSTPLEIMEEAVVRRGAWILKQQRQFKMLERPAVPPRTYVSGETHRFLGRQYRLKVVESTIVRVIRSRNDLRVEIPIPTDTFAVQQQLDAWFLAQAERIFAERLTHCFARVAHWDVEKPVLRIRPMKARWGSLTPKGTLTLHQKLIQAPVELIDYVIYHELCHLREMNHKTAFYTLLDQVLPDWRDLQHQLNIYEFL
ncbi:MAG: YgjP-like metallopeptidase domain-containing protein [bacterium]|nr:YgjP-like metallopeptidase domain-containing protein [bacterium]